MSISSVNNSELVMTLGVVSLNNTRYLAVLHFNNEEGENALDKGQIQRIKNEALKRFEEVLIKYNDQPDLISKVDNAGFYQGDKLIKHDSLKSSEEWNKFVNFILFIKVDDEDDLLTQNEESSSTLMLNLEDNRVREKFVNQLCDKLQNAPRDKEGYFERPVLNHQEREFLMKKSHFKVYKNLLNGKYDLREMSSLLSEYSVSCPDSVTE